MTPSLSNPVLRTQSDERLAALAATGHDRAFEAIVERYRRPLSRYLQRLLSEPLAEDVLQATFVHAWQALGSGAAVRELRPWLYRIAHNQAVNALRVAAAALPPGSQPPVAASAEGEVERREELRLALNGIVALPDRQRAALVAVAVDDRSHADVAAELGLTDGALRQLLMRARTSLRAAVTALTPYPLVAWLSSGSEVTAARVTEVAAGAGGIGMAVKAGATVLAAGALAVGAHDLRDEHAPPRATSGTAQESIVRVVKAGDDHPARSMVVAGDNRRGSTGVVLRSGDDRRASSSGPGSGDDDRSAHGRSHSGSGDDSSERSGSGARNDSTESGGTGSDDDRSGSSGASRPSSGSSAPTLSAPRESNDDGSGGRESAHDLLGAKGSGSDDFGGSESDGSSGSTSSDDD
jgi:RNA polymerase sigma factor (sigma-70 family)